MKLNLGNGWVQEVSYKDGEEISKYVKDGKEYTREEYLNQKSGGVNEQEESITLAEVADTLGNIVLEEGPFFLTTIDENGERKDEVSREEILEHYLNWATETIGEMEEVENEQGRFIEINNEASGIMINLNNIDGQMTFFSHLIQDIESYKDVMAALLKRGELEKQLNAIYYLLDNQLEEIKKYNEKISLLSGDEND